MSPVRGPRRRGTLRAVAAAVVAAVVLGGAVGLGLSEWDQYRHPAPAAPPPAATAPVVGQAGEAAVALGGPAPALPPEATVEEVAAAVIPATVTVWTDIPSGVAGLQTRGAGTGILLTPDGIVLTNNHVISGAASVTVTRPYGGEDFDAQVLGYDRTRDIALLQLTGPGGAPPSGLPAAALGESVSLRLGQQVVAVGNAGGTGSLITSPGTVTGFDQSIRATDTDGSAEDLDGVVQIAADINPGDSGGPLADMTGHVVAVNTAKSESAEAQAAGGRGYAVPMEDALRVARVVLSGGPDPAGSVHVGPTAQLGVRVRTRASTLPPRGAQVVEVVPGSAAAGTALAPGDVITAVDGRPVDGADALTGVIDRHAPGDVLHLEWVDASGAVVAAPVTLDAGLPR